ncbi:hypothetical protein [Bacillus wiedmannii]|uniref:hypothetical protein n=1 Tax=Bacillus wiedmannii TaxID=1890302 RepID=UPI0015CF7580|nr:hypothetical protein [Bacillus wiedmannii]
MSDAIAIVAMILMLVVMWLTHTGYITPNTMAWVEAVLIGIMWFASLIERMMEDGY